MTGWLEVALAIVSETPAWRKSTSLVLLSQLHGANAVMSYQDMYDFVPATLSYNELLFNMLALH